MKSTILILMMFFSLKEIKGQLNLDWKEMASLDYYYYKGPLFWNFYDSLNTKYKKNIIRAKKLGCNIVRIPLNFIPNDFDISAPFYDHGWVDSTELGSGKVFKNTKYLKDINDLIDFCDSLGMKLNLLLFNHGLSTKNCAGFHNSEGTKYQSYYTKLGTDKNWIDLTEINLWFIDATAWINKILSNIDLNKIAVFEIRNEAYPNYNSNILYPTYFYDIFLLEMTSYIRSKYPQKELMISITQIDNLIYFRNLQKMLSVADSNFFKRPEEIRYSNHNLNSNFYFNYFSFHNYNTYSYRKSFQDILDLGRLQTKDYKWYLGEFGYDMGTKGSFEADQAKQFLSNFQIISDYVDTLKLKGTPLKGLGIWSTFDYEYLEEKGCSYGITRSENIELPRKRKAAFIVENFLEGLIANPGFEINTGPIIREPNFDDAEKYNGWKPWWDTTNGLNYNSYFSITGSKAERKAQIEGRINKKFGWSSLPARNIQVLPGTNLKVEVDASINGDIGNGKVFPYLKWYNKDNIFIKETEEVNQLKSSSENIKIEEIVPDSAFYAEPYLMAWNIPDGTTVKFENVHFSPEAVPLIELNFNNETSDSASRYITKNLGWDIDDSIYFNLIETENILQLKKGGIIRSTHPININQTTSMRLRPNKEYSVLYNLQSDSAEVEISFHKTDENDYPISDVKQGDYLVKDNIMKNEFTEWFNSSNYKWLNISVKSFSDSTFIKKFVVFERNPSY